MDTTLEQLRQATLRLVQQGSIKDRLAEAYALHLLDVDIDTLPENLRDEFASFSEAMQRETPLPRETAIRASVRKMSNAEAGEYAELVVRSFTMVATQLTGNALRRPHRPLAAPIVQLFASEG